MGRRTTRRDLLKGTAAAGMGYWMGTGPTKAFSDSPNEKLNIGVVGVGGKGESNILGVRSQNIIAACDVDEERAKGFRIVSKAAKYKDFRKMLEKEKSLDAVVVSTPDHTHAPAAVMAMRLGKHVYCEKPLAHSIYESRLMRKVAQEMKVATQMGNQGHSGNTLREAVKLIQSGGLGKVTEFHAWTNRPSWKQGLERPTETVPVPKTLDWDLWLGTAPERPYNPAYCPFSWRGWWDFGTGALGDMACHIADLGFWGLDLKYPTSVVGTSSGVNAETAPNSSVIKFQFPSRGDQPPVIFTWYDGGKKPDPALVGLNELPNTGSILVGDKGTMYVPDEYGQVYQVLPKDSKDPRPAPPPPPGRLGIVAIAVNHYKEWIDACKGGAPAQSNFDYASLLTEVILLGNVALRAGKQIEWDGEAMKATNCPEAEAWIRPAFRPGWDIS
ncbi:MAG: Gfo/Idh/MocA family oxidoreductase [Planctomycetota bacterium]